MPYDSQGNFTRVHNWEQDRKNDIKIMSDRHDEEDDNFTAGLNECLLRDGRVAMEGNLNIGNFQVKNVAQASADNDAVNLAQVNAIKENVINELLSAISLLHCIGDIKPSLQSVNHNDWLLCDGQAVSRTEYADLFALIGTSFGNGDGVNTFNIPDYRGKFLRGLGGNSAADVYTTQTEGLPNITGEIVKLPSPYSDFHDGTGAFHTTNIGGTAYSGNGNGSNYKLNFDASESNAIYGANEHVTPINQAVNWFIKAKG